MRLVIVILALMLLAIAVSAAMVGGEMTTCPWCVSDGPSMVFTVCAAILTMALSFRSIALACISTFAIDLRSTGSPARLFKPPRAV